MVFVSKLSSFFKSALFPRHDFTLVVVQTRLIFMLTRSLAHQDAKAGIAVRTSKELMTIGL
jgi:hypothetical protein